jgi:hypothetical protein
MRDIVERIAELSVRHGLKGRILTFGRLYPNLDVTYGSARNLLDRLGLAASSLREGEDDELMAHEEAYFQALGYDALESLDISDYEGATHIWDLNRPEIPSDLTQRFDVILNNGTLEHIFNVPNCLSNVTQMLKPGGYIIHEVPCHNHFDHGFYTFSPCLFFDYYAANKFQILESTVYRRDRPGDIARVWGTTFFNPYEQTPGDAFTGRMDSGCYFQTFMARKTDESTDDVVPIQGDYSRLAGDVRRKAMADSAAAARRREEALNAEIASLTRLIEQQKQLIEQKDQAQTNLYRQILALQGLDPS